MFFPEVGIDNVANQLVSCNDLSVAHTLIAEMVLVGWLFGVIKVGGKTLHV
jgi:hypothetical protein